MVEKARPIAANAVDWVNPPHKCDSSVEQLARRRQRAIALFLPTVIAQRSDQLNMNPPPI